MHYSNWLIGVKNRASIRNACKTPNIEEDSRGHPVEMQKKNPSTNRKASELTLAFGISLWKKGIWWVMILLNRMRYHPVSACKNVRPTGYNTAKTMVSSVGDLVNAFVRLIWRLQRFSSVVCRCPSLLSALRVRVEGEACSVTKATVS